ncbi:hypothetical protein [Propionivibrio sp.]|uniref:hypothetical protein n=1 Tax=Propionivibrio sp. TaxID=2212460 RepID=UPI002631BA0B|nr:hypothetical protein [Propionivibrio sp.]
MEMTARTNAELAADMYGPQADAPATPPAPQASPEGQRTAQELGEALYGKPAADPTQQPADDAPIVKRTDAELATAMYPEPEEPVVLDPVPPDVAAIRDDIARRLYSAQDTFAEAIPDKVFANVAGLDPAAGRKTAAELREISADLDLAPQDVQKLRERITYVQTNQPTVAAQWDETVSLLNAEYGTDAKQALRDARALLRRDPRAARVIEAMGLGNDPQTVMIIARRARSAKGTGRIK